MAMDLSNQTYQPVNIGSGMTEAFKAGTGVYSDLSSNIRSLLQSGMSEEGAMRRTQVQERGQMEREKMSQAGQNLRAGIPAAGTSSISIEDIDKMSKDMPAGASRKFRTAEGHEVTVTGAKLSPYEMAMKYTAQVARSIYPQFDVMDADTKMEILDKLFDKVATKIVPDYKPGTGTANVAIGAGNVAPAAGAGIGAAVNNVLGTSPVQAATTGPGLPAAGTGTTGQGSPAYQQLVSILAAQGYPPTANNIRRFLINNPNFAARIKRGV